MNNIEQIAKTIEDRIQEDQKHFWSDDEEDEADTTDSEDESDPSQTKP